MTQDASFNPDDWDGNLEELPLDLLDRLRLGHVAGDDLTQRLFASKGEAFKAGYVLALREREVGDA